MTDETRNLLGDLIRDATGAIGKLREEFGKVKGEVSSLREDISRIEGKVDAKTSIIPVKKGVPWSTVMKVASALAIIGAGIIGAAKTF